MEVTVHNELVGCPEGCPHLRAMTDSREIAGVLYVFVDCDHSEVCAMWDGSEGGDPPCRTSTRS